MSNSSEYYSPNELLARNGVFNIIVGGRGVGKTYAFKRFVLDRYRNHGEQFIWLRRFKTEIPLLRTFLDDLPDEYREWYKLRRSGGVDFVDEGNKGRVRPAGYFVALSGVSARKSVAYPGVHWIVFDEAILPGRGRYYTSDEPTVLTEFYSTVDRYQDRARLILLGNAASISAPYFHAWGVSPWADGGRFRRAGGGFVQCEMVPAGIGQALAARSRFGAWAAKTDPDYAAYAIDNEFRDGGVDMVEPPPDRRRPVFGVLFRRGAVTFYDAGRGLWYADSRRRGDAPYYAEDIRVTPSSDGGLPAAAHLLRSARDAMYDMRMTYSSVKVRELVYDLLAGRGW